MLALVTEREALLGRVRFELKETIPVLKKLLSTLSNATNFLQDTWIPQCIGLNLKF